MRVTLQGGILLAALLSLMTAPALQAQERPERRARAETLRPGWLGFAYTTVAGPEGERLLIERVLEGSPAERAGIEVGDTVVQWNGRADVARALLENPLRPGETVRLRVRRAGERDRELTVRVGERPREFVEMRRGRDDEVIVIRPGAVLEALRLNSDSLRIRLDSLAVHADSLHRRLRVMLRDSLGPRLREMEREIPDVHIRMRRGVEGEPGRMEPLRLDFDLGARAVAGAEFTRINEGLSDYFGVERGVVVLRVAPSTPAARAGLQAGDVIVEANGSAVDDVRSLRRAVSRARERTVELEVIRKGKRRSLSMRWE